MRGIFLAAIVTTALCAGEGKTSEWTKFASTDGGKATYYMNLGSFAKDEQYDAVTIWVKRVGPKKGESSMQHIACRPKNGVYSRGTWGYIAAATYQNGSMQGRPVSNSPSEVTWEVAFPGSVVYSLLDFFDYVVKRNREEHDAPPAPSSM